MSEQKSMEDVLRKTLQLINVTDEIIKKEWGMELKAMSEWASIQCAEKDKEIAKLESSLLGIVEAAKKRNDEKNATISELLTALEASNDLLVKNSYGEERGEANYQLIQKYKS